MEFLIECKHGTKGEDFIVDTEDNMVPEKKYNCSEVNPLESDVDTHIESLGDDTTDSKEEDCFIFSKKKYYKLGCSKCGYRLITVRNPAWNNGFSLSLTCPDCGMRLNYYFGDKYRNEIKADWNGLDSIHVVRTENEDGKVGRYLVLK